MNPAPLFSPTAPAAVESDALSQAADRLAELQARIRGMERTRIDSPGLPTTPAIAALLPDGVLRAGVSYSVRGSTALAMAMMAGPSAAGEWCGVVGIPSFGVEAAERAGIDLERLVLVPEPGEQWLQVTAAMADVVTIVLARPPRELAPAELARLASRLRQRGSTLIALGELPQSEAQLLVAGSSWSGLGRGHGLLDGQRLTVEVRGRRVSGQGRRHTVVLEEGERGSGLVVGAAVRAVAVAEFAGMGASAATAALPGAPSERAAEVALPLGTDRVAASVDPDSLPRLTAVGTARELQGVAS